MPEVERLLRSCMEAKLQYESAEAEIIAFMKRIAFTGGMVVSTDKISEAKRRKEASTGILKAAVQRFEEIGCQIKDLDTGLLDFPTLYRGKEVYLCWKLGESGISFWHHVEDGFKGRKQIDSEFLQNHGAE